METKIIKGTGAQDMEQIAIGLMRIIRDSPISVGLNFKTGGTIKEADIHVTFFGLEKRQNCEIAFYSYRTMKDNLSIFDKVIKLIKIKADYPAFKELARSL